MLSPLFVCGVIQFLASTLSLLLNMSSSLAGIGRIFVKQSGLEKESSCVILEVDRVWTDELSWNSIFPSFDMGRKCLRVFSL